MFAEIWEQHNSKWDTYMYAELSTNAD